METKGIHDGLESHDRKVTLKFMVSPFTIMLNSVCRLCYVLNDSNGVVSELLNIVDSLREVVKRGSGVLGFWVKESARSLPPS